VVTGARRVLDATGWQRGARCHFRVCAAPDPLGVRGQKRPGTLY
jgi:hypothetical protein